MDEKEYEKFMTYLYSEYVRSRNKWRIQKHFHPGEWEWDWRRLVNASNLLRYLNHHCNDEDEIYRTIKENRIAQLPDEILHGARTNRYMLEESGFLDAIEAYYDEIVAGMKMEHMPPQEIEVIERAPDSERRRAGPFMARSLSAPARSLPTAPRPSPLDGLGPNKGILATLADDSTPVRDALQVSSVGNPPGSSGFRGLLDSLAFALLPVSQRKQLGSAEPEAELSALVYIVKSRSKSRYSCNELKISRQLKNLEQELEQQEQELKKLKEDSEQPKKSRRWFKGLGQIAQGSALSIANIGLAIGVIPMPVAAETAGWGAIVSSITGVGMVLNGIGEFKGE